MPLWTCPKCGAKFFQKNLWHSCERITVKGCLAGKPEKSVKLYHAFVKQIRKIGPIIIHPVKTRMLVRFAGSITKDYLKGALWLTESHANSTVYRVEKLLPKCHIHHFRLSRSSDTDAEFRPLLTLASVVGQRTHITKPKLRKAEI